MDAGFINEVILKAYYMRNNESTVSRSMKGKIIAMLFYEASTRTRFSFETASLRLGAQTVTTENAKEFSSASKGETLQDTIKIMSNYADIIVLRHFEDDAALVAASASSVPIINAGAGRGQHPTQALLDVFTIHENFGRLDNLRICCVGDLLHGRTINSLVYLLAKFPGNSFIFVSPPHCRIKEGLKEHLSKEKVCFSETGDMISSINQADIVYMTRVQKERFDDLREYERAKGKYILTEDNIRNMKEESIIMHPLPRVDEIHQSVDGNHRAKYFEQARNGLYVRMALLSILNEHISK